MLERRQLIRRMLLGGVVGAAAGALSGCALPGASASRARFVVVGGGFGGATVSKYIRLLSDHAIDVTLIEPNPQFVSCPMSNLVVGGLRDMADITSPYTGLAGRHGVRIVADRADSVDPVGRTVALAGGGTVGYDRLVIAPGVDMVWDSIEGLQQANAAGQVLHAWKAGPDTLALRRQLEAMPDGGTFAIVIPEAPYRCPPGPYERASLVAAYFRRAKPRSKVLILDANPDIVSKGPLFKKAWAELYPGMVEYRPEHRAVGVEGATRTVKFDVQDDVKADVLNVLPTMRAGELAVRTGLANANARWCHVDFLNFESTVHKHIHVIGDAIQVAAGMPKSGQMANSQAKVTAAAIVAELMGLELDPHPMLTNVCMSFVDEAHVIHVASVHEYVPTQKTFRTIGGSGGVSDVRSDLEGRYAKAWARNIWADTLM
jgi:NADPH-dependent 2,4-dienoyl-CoA reductase/sulfur reductase-like enzyme